MFIAFKIVKIGLKIAAAAVIVLLGYLVYQFKVAKAEEVSFGPITVTRSGQSYKLVIDTSEKGYLKIVADKMNSVIYQEATEHNPAGDILPDQIDDKVKQKIKEHID